VRSEPKTLKSSNTSKSVNYHPASAISEKSLEL